MGWLNDIGEFFVKLKNPHLFIVDQLTFIIEMYQKFLMNILGSKLVNDSLGGIVLISVALLILVNFIVSTIMMATFWKNHSHRIGMVFSTIGTQFLFIVGFYPLCFAALYIINALQWFIAWLMGIEPAALTDLVNKMVIPTGLDPFWGPVVIMLIAILGGVLLIVMGAIMAFTVLFVLLYPIAIALRPLGRFFDGLFHALTAGIIVMIFAPVLTTGCLAIPLIVYRHVPLGNSGLMQAILIIISYGAAAYLPLQLWWSLRKKSIETYGRVESNVSGSIDVNSLPPQTYANGRRDDDDASDSPLKSFVQVAAIGAVGAAIGDREDARETLKNVGADALASAALATKNPYLVVGGLAIQAANSSSNARKERQREEQAQLNKLPPPEMPLWAYPPPADPDQHPLPGT